MEKLTKKQEEVLTVIKKYIAEHGYAPSVREVCELMNLSSTATVFVHMRHLMKKGYLKQTDNKFRTLEVLVPNEYLEKNEDVVNVPLLGKVTCGNPIEAIEFPDEYIALPAFMIPKKEEIFTLKTEGMSMKNVGIYDGDEIVGYVMVIYDYDIPEYDIWHMMIDASKQGRGYGSEALRLVLEYIKTKPFGDSNRVTLTCNKDNQVALELYHKAGFVETGEEDDEEIELSQRLA